MSATAVFFRTLMKTSAIFIGTAIVFLHPPLDSTSSRGVTAVQSGAESVIDALTHRALAAPARVACSPKP